MGGGRGECSKIYLKGLDFQFEYLVSNRQVKQYYKISANLPVVYYSLVLISVLISCSC